MHSSRASSRALRQLAASQQTRSLHVIGPATIPAQLPPRPSYKIRERVAGPFSPEVPQNVATLHTESQDGKLPKSGSKFELIDRLSTPENKRAYSTATQDSRSFSTTPRTKKSGDQCSFNFAFMPDFDPTRKMASVMPVLPVMPGTMAFEAAEIEEAAVAQEEALPTVFTVAHVSTHIHAPSAMFDVSDIAPVDFHGLAAQMTKKITKPIEEGVGMSRQLWNGLVDDILGPKGGSVSRG